MNEVEIAWTVGRLAIGTEVIVTPTGGGKAPYRATVADNGAAYPSREATRGWYVVVNEFGKRFDALVDIVSPDYAARARNRAREA